MNKLVSTIITTCNRFDLFKIALTSVQNQTYQETEIIVVDGSDINVVQNYIKQYPNIIYVNHKSKHPNVLRNIGIECASGELLAFLDDDDMWENDKLALQVQCLENSNIGLCYTGKNILNSNNNKIKYSYHAAKFKSDRKSIKLLTKPKIFRVNRTGPLPIIFQQPRRGCYYFPLRVFIPTTGRFMCKNLFG